MPLATDCGSFGAIGVPQFVNPGTSQSNFPYQGSTWFNTGPYRKPISSELTVTGVTTLTDKLDRLQFSMPSATSTLVVAQGIIPPVPYTLDCMVVFQGNSNTGDSTLGGLCLSDGTKYLSATPGTIGGTGAGAGSRFLYYKWNNRTTITTRQVDSDFVCGQPVWVRIQDDGSLRYIIYSQNGKDYAQVYQEATNTFLTPTTWGLCAYWAGLTGSNNAKVSFYHMQAQGGLLGDAP